MEYVSLYEYYMAIICTHNLTLRVKLSNTIPQGDIIFSLHLEAIRDITTGDGDTLHNCL